MSDSLNPKLKAGKKWDGIEESKLMPFRMVDLEDLIYNNVLGLGFF